MNGIPWTTDGLSDPADREVVGTARVDGVLYLLVHDSGPNRWYISRVRSGVRERTVVYGSRNAPGLRRAWNAVRSNPAE
jgi:hypothetical protein